MLRTWRTVNGIPFEEFDPEFRNRLLLHRYAHFVSCWHISHHESEAMWKLYARAESGIAIQSTVGDVKERLRPHNSGAVIYYDPSQDVLCSSIFGPHDILFKRSHFSWEREYRFWFDDDELIGRIEAGKEFREENVSPGGRWASATCSGCSRRSWSHPVRPTRSSKGCKSLVPSTGSRGSRTFLSDPPRIECGTPSLRRNSRVGARSVADFSHGDRRLAGCR